MLVTGLVSYVHYGVPDAGFQLHRFRAPLDPRWTLVREYPPLLHTPDAEPVRVWRLGAARGPGG